MEETMPSIRPISMRSISEAIIELEKMGFPFHQAESMAVQTLSLHLKVEGVDDEMIPYLEKTARSIGVSLIKSPICSQDSRRRHLLLSGSHTQFEKLATTVEDRSPEFYEASAALKDLLQSIGRTRFTIPCRTGLLELGGRTLIMGTINVTPDSFSDGGMFFQKDSAVKRALEMVEEGADLIDIGGESTRPGSKAVDAEEELRRVIPVIKGVARQTDTPVCVDTRKALVARGALEAGAQIVNDVSALRFDPEMAGIVASHRVPIVLMHMLGTPETMQQEIHYVSLISEIAAFLGARIDLARRAGVDVEKTIIDPGIGFGKTVEHNLALIKHLSQLRILGRPLLIGTSRKSFIGKILGSEVDQREEGTMATLAASILNGAHIIRVHNVRNAVRVALITDAIKAVSIPEV